MSEGIYKKKGQANIWRNDNINIMNEYCLQQEVRTSELSNLYSAPLKKENSISKQFVRLLSDRGETENICSSNECSEAGHCDSRGVEKSSKIECSTGKESSGDMGSRLV